jgi:hypothetical protein
MKMSWMCLMIDREGGRQAESCSLGQERQREGERDTHGVHTHSNWAGNAHTLTQIGREMHTHSLKVGGKCTHTHSNWAGRTNARPPRATRRTPGRPQQPWRSAGACVRVFVCVFACVLCVCVCVFCVCVCVCANHHHTYQPINPLFPSVPPATYPPTNPPTHPPTHTHSQSWARA